MYWGQFGKVKVSGGASTARRRPATTRCSARRACQVDFWDPEDGYYLNGTYYGDKNLLAIGAAGQVQGERQVGLQRRLPAREARSAKAAPSRSKPSGRSTTGSAATTRGTAPTTAATSSARYLFPKTVGIGKFEVLGKFAQARFREGLTPLDADYDQKTTELNLNYVIKQFNARVMMFFKDTRFDAVRPTSSSSASASRFRCDACSRARHRHRRSEP